MTIPSVFQPGFRLLEGDKLNAAMANPLSSYTSGVTATASGTVLTSYVVSNYFTEIDTVASAGDGVALPQAVAGKEFTIINNGANAITVFATSSSTINGTAGATGVSQAAGTVVTYSCAKNGAWMGTSLGGSLASLVVAGLATVGSLKIDTGTKTATATAGAATLNKNAGVITSESLTTAAGATYTLTLTDSAIAAADQVMASVQLGSATTGMPVVTTVTPGAGSVVIVIQNIHASAALNGTIKIAFAVFKN